VTVVKMKLRPGLIGTLLLVQGCTTLTGESQGQQAGADARPSGAAVVQGGLVAGQVGADLSASDRRKALEAEYRALEFGTSGQSVAWGGGWSGRSGTVVPGQPYRVGSQDCRQYTHTVTSDGANKMARGTACRNADGSWTTLS
jgi:surface antigen